MQVVKATIAGVAAVNIGLLGAVASLSLYSRTPPSASGSSSPARVTPGDPSSPVTSTVPVVAAPPASPSAWSGGAAGVQARAVAPPAIANLGPSATATSYTTTTSLAPVPSTTLAAPTTIVTSSTSSPTTTATTVPKSTTTTVCAPSGGGPTTTVSGCNGSSG